MVDHLADAHYQTVERIWNTARPVHHDTSPGFFAKIADEAEVLLRPGGNRLLDVGCGTGALIDILAARGFDCYGFDFAQAKVDAAQQRNPGRVWKQSFLTEYLHGPFDYVISYSVLQYCRPVDMPTVLLRSVEALKVGGKALHMAIPVMERFEQANGLHYSANTEAELIAHRRRFMVGAMESQPVNDDGTFFHSAEKIAEIVTGFGHEVRMFQTGTSPYRLTVEIVRKH
jgi:2-polyprenyl-3-methyl-5-hydroxy-6-metoxy-1,4-benzoquinol methylase